MKKLTPKQLLEKKREHIRTILAKFGVYVSLLLGITADKLFPNLDFKKGLLDATVELKALQPWHILVAALMALFLYSKIEKGGELSGKIKSVSRLLRTSFFIGFFCMEVLGRFDIGI